ncbi:MAG: hypothetical protein ACRESZ_05570 [Methylococcales bacterium]
MKRFLLAFVSATSLWLGTTTLAAESDSVKTVTAPGPLTIPVMESAGVVKKENSPSVQRRKPFTPADIRRAEARKKVEWWQMPKPPVPETRRWGGGPHAGH